MRLWSAIRPNAVVANSLISLGGFLGAGIVGYLFQVLLTRRLSVEQYGEFQSLLSLFALLGVAAAALLTFVVAHTAVFASSRDAATTRFFLRSLERRTVPVAGVLFALLLLFTPLVRDLLHLSDLWGFPLTAAAAVVSLLVVLPQGTLMGWQAFLPVNVVLVVGALVKLLVGVPLVLRIPRASAAAGALLVSALGNWLLFRRAREKLLGRPPATAGAEGADWRARYFPARSLRWEVTYVALFGGLVALLQNLDVLLVKYFGPASLAGHYGGFILVSRLALWASASVVNVVLPVASARSHAGQPLGAGTRAAAYGLLALLAAGVLAPALVVPGSLVRILLGPAYVPYASATWLFAAQGALASLLLFEANVAYARRDRRLPLLLGGSVGLLALGVLRFHSTLEAIVVAVIAASGIGYVGVLLRNLLASPRPVPVTRVPAPGLLS